MGVPSEGKLIPDRFETEEIFERILAAADEDPMAAVRTAVSELSAYDPDADADPTDVDANLRKGKRITAKLPTIVAAFARCRNGDDPVEPREDLDHAANFLYMLNDEEPDDVLADVFDQALVLHADHGLNASTFSSMVTSSTLADMHSAVTSAIGTLGGSLHGGANANVMRMLKEVDESDLDPTAWVETALDEGRRVPGFGHRVYNVKDPRAKILGEKSKALAETAGETKWYDYSVAIEEYIAEEKGLNGNTVALAWMLDRDQPTVPVLGVSTIEQLEQNLAAAELSFTDDERRRLNEIESYGFDGWDVRD